MIRFLKLFALALIVAHVGLLATARPATAQQAVVVTGYPAQPIFTYFPERRGLFGQRVVYKPVVTYSTPTPPVVAVPTSPARVTVRYAPPAYAVPAPVVVARPVAPVVVARPVAPVVVAPPPVVVAPAPVAVPAPVVTGYPPIIVP